jgi:hypothetical protein
MIMWFKDVLEILTMCLAIPYALYRLCQIEQHLRRSRKTSTKG